MSAPECDCAAVYESIPGGVQMMSPFVKHCPFHKEATRMYETLEAVQEIFADYPIASAMIGMTLAAARGETERVR